MTETSIKKRLFISTTPTSAHSQAGYAGLIWVQVKGIATIGQVGFNHATIDAPDLESGITTTLKGGRQGVAASMAFRTQADDPGQAAVLVAHNTEGEVSIQIVNPDGETASFWTGIVHSLIENEASITSYEGKTFSFVANYEGVTGTAVIPST